MAASSSWLALVVMAVGLSGLGLATEIRNLTIPLGVLAGRPCALVPNVTAFLGVPYAVSPIGDLRFRPSVLYDQAYTAGYFDATDYGQACGSPCDATAGTILPGTVAEDCLNMNIWVPLNSGKFGDMEVRVYIHGGMNTACNANDAHIDGCFSAESTQSITINLNYRLGASGFFAHPQTFAESNTTGNWGLHDHQTALKWIQAYISYFGGNASKVMIYGGSSGGSLVSQHMSIESSFGLFTSAITQSATCFEALTLEEAYAQTDNISVTVGCPGDRSAEDLQCLRDVSLDTITNAIEDIISDLNCYAHDRFPVPSPVIDGYFLKEQLVESMEGGRSNPVPFLVGSNKDEGRFFLQFLLDNPYETTEATTIEFLEEVFLDANITELLSLYPIEMFAKHEYPEYERLATILTDLYVRCPASRMLNARSQYPEVPLYNYMFFHTPSCPVDTIDLGCTHGSELMSVFGNTIFVYPPSGTCNYTEAEQKMADAFMYAWSHMASNGVPSLQNGDTFPLWDRTNQTTTALDLEISFGINDISTRCEAFQAIVDQYVQSGHPRLSNRLRVTYGSRASTTQ